MIVTQNTLGTVIKLSIVTLGLVLTEQTKALTGDNVCSQQVLETKQVNVSYLEQVRIKKHSLCLKIPPVCADWVNTMVTRWKLENVTRTVDKQMCCPGYQQASDADTCEAVCSDGCHHGECTEPEVCTCHSGFSGSQCQTVGCPRGSWGPDCGHTCPCQNGGWCDPVTGDCTCAPGFLGVTCTDTCPTGTWGEMCNNDCDCDTGEMCHHVTGTCSPCQAGSWGDDCLNTCKCNKEGTELCSHKDGRCFCKGNWFGRVCEMNCPFGFTDNTCHKKQPSGNGTCQCANDLYICDKEKGCICPDGNCGIEVIDDTVWLSPFSDAEKTETDQHTAAISLSVIFIALVAIVLVVIYYRRRMSVMRKDIQNRSVYYSDRESPDKSDRSYDLIVRDNDPVTFNRVANNVSLDDGGANGAPMIHKNAQMLNNVRLNLDSQQYQQQSANNGARVKNVNINNVQNGAHCETKDSSAAYDYDINVFSSEDKSNLNQRYQPKVLKQDLEVMIRNNLVDDEMSHHDDKDKDTDTDSVHKLKVNLTKN